MSAEPLPPIAPGGTSPVPVPATTKAARLEDMGLVGNCQFSALVSKKGDVVWCCLPRFDSEPVFGRLLDESGGGAFSIRPADGSPGNQRYLENTNVLETTFNTPDGAFRIVDFAPRFLVYERGFRPTMLVRIVEPLSGTPRIAAACEPVLGWSKKGPRREMGSDSVSFDGYESELRLTTDVPLSYLGGSQSFALTERRHFVLSWGAPPEEALASLCERFLRQTVRYWMTWVKHCDIPPLYQSQVIRSALALKLHCFEDTGAIIAGTTTSVPESKGSGRTWDYRYCWLRDAYYSLDAFRLLGHFEEREQFLTYLLNIASSNKDLDLAPLYRIDATCNIDEHILGHWSGYLGEGPVRIGNAAALHHQHDIFGEMVLALAPLFLDDRFRQDQPGPVLDLVKRLARKAISVAGTPDAGIWEYRTDWQPQTFSSLMCWAAADRMATIAARYNTDVAPEFATAAERIREQIMTRGWNAERASLVATYDGQGLDASLLQAIPLRLLAPSDPRMASTVDAITNDLTREGWLFRYRQDDGFGVPTVAFVICTFWLVQALATLGRTAEARRIMDIACGVLAPLGLISEDWDMAEKRMWGNFPQAYSHVGLIHAAFAASPPWSEVI